GLHNHGGQEHFRALIIVVDARVEAVAESYFFDFQIKLEVFELILKGDQLLVVFAQGSPKEIRKLERHVACFLGLASDQRNDRVEAIEEEVRLELLAQVIKFRFACQALGVRFSIFVFLVFALDIPKDVNDGYPSNQ